MVYPLYDISIVIPVYNSEPILPDLIRRIQAVLPTISTRYEIILINDGSKDHSWAVICDLALKYSSIRGINLMRNFGQHNALLCGIRNARYKITITMDDDLQHPPEEITHLLNKLAEGYDVVYGTPRKLSHSFWRNLSSKFTKQAMSKAMGIQNVRDINAFRAFKTNLREAFQDYQSPNLLLDVLLSWGTTSFAVVEVDHQPRLIGKSNYSFFRLLNQAMLILTGFSTAPLRLASLIGFIVMLFGIIVLIYVIGNYLIRGGGLPGFSFLASIIVIFAGTQLFVIGIIGEYLARIYNRSLERPTYVISDITVGFIKEK